MSDDVYKAVGFDAHKIGFGERPGIAVVDFQRGFTEPEYPLGGRPMVVRAVENTATMLAAARKLNIPVASCYTSYTAARDAPYWKIPAVTETFHHGEKATELDPRIWQPGYDAVYCKTGPSIFFQTAITQFFIKERVDTVIVAGCNTSGCIRASVIDASHASPSGSAAGVEDGAAGKLSTAAPRSDATPDAAPAPARRSAFVDPLSWRCSDTTRWSRARVAAT